MSVRIDRVRLGERHRRDLGSVASLAASIREIGLLHPIVITRDNLLIAGRRRLEAFKALGRDEIPATVVGRHQPQDSPPVGMAYCDGSTRGTNRCAF